MHSLLLHYLVDVVDHLARRVFIAANEDGHVGDAIKQIGIADQSHRRGIDDDVLVALAQLGEQFFYARTLQQLGWVRRNSTTGDEVQILMLAARNDDIVKRHFGLRQIIGQMPLGLQAEIGRQHRFTDIHTYQHHFLSEDSQGQRRITGYVRFTVSVDATGDQDHRCLHVGRQDKPEVGSYQSE